MIAALLAVTNPGDEVIIFEPYYENYGPDIAVRCATQTCAASASRLDVRSGGTTPRVLAEDQGDILTRQTIRREVFTPYLQLIADLCQEFDALQLLTNL